MRLRIQNTEFGAIEASVDGGRTWELVGRVISPADRTAPGASGTLPIVERASAHGVAIAVGGGRLVRLLPDTTAGRPDGAAIVTNRAPRDALFASLLPSRDSPVQLVTRGEAVALPANYTPRDGDTLMVTCQRAAAGAAELGAALRAGAEAYRGVARARARREGRRVVTGHLTVVARAPASIQVSAVTFTVDGERIAIVNAPPFTARWDTRSWRNGEHMVDIQARDARGTLVTRAKRLVYVDNPAPSPGQR